MTNPFERFGISEPSPETRQRNTKLRAFSSEITSNLPKAFYSSLEVQNWIISLIQDMIADADYSTSMDKIKSSYAKEKEVLDETERAYIIGKILPKFKDEFGVEIDLE